MPKLMVVEHVEHDCGMRGCSVTRQREPAIPEVVEWLSEQGAIDYDAAAKALGYEMVGWSPQLDQTRIARSVIDAALRPPVSSSQENPDG